MLGRTLKLFMFRDRISTAGFDLEPAGVYTGVHECLHHFRRHAGDDGANSHKARRVRRFEDPVCRNGVGALDPSEIDNRSQSLVLA